MQKTAPTVKSSGPYSIFDSDSLIPDIAFCRRSSRFGADNDRL